MKYFFFYVIILFFIYFLGFVRVNKEKYEYQFMDKIHTSIIKGIAILLVVTVHVDAFWSKVGGIQFIGGVGVALFLICSGYGLYYSYEKYGLKDFFYKKFVKIYLPFLFVEILSIPLWNNISFQKIFLDFSLIKPVSSFAWYMNYLMVCYILFYCVMMTKEKKRLKDKNVLGLFFVLFVAWFVLDSTILVNPDIPMLKSRQMLSFIFGICLAMKKIKHVHLNIGALNIVIGIAMMALTQLPAIKSLPFISYNLLSLGTVFPLAIGVLSITSRYKYLFQNKLLIFISMISYEIYLIHQYSIYILTEIRGIKAVVIFLSVTILLAYLLQLFSRRVSKRIIKLEMKNGRFNSGDIN